MQSWAVASSRCWSRFGAAGGDRFRGIRYARPGTPILHSKIQAIRDEREYAAADSAEPRRPRYAASRLLTANSQGSWARPMLAWLASSSGAPTSSSAARAETSAKWRFCPNQVFRANLATAAQAGLAFAIYPFRDGVENTPDPSPSYRSPKPRFLHSRFLCKFNGLRV